MNIVPGQIAHPDVNADNAVSLGTGQWKTLIVDGRIRSIALSAS